MNKISISLFLLLIVICSYAPLAAAQSETNVLKFDLGESTGWVPYRTGKTADQAGILADLILLIEETSNITFDSVHWPQKRAEFALVKGIVDFDFICTAWFPGGTYGRKFVISEHLFEINEFVITLKGNKHLFPTLESIYTKPVGTIAGYFYFDDYQFTRVNFRDEDALIKALKYKRIDAIILEQEAAKHWANINNVEIEMAAPHTTGNLLIRLNKNKKDKLPAINTAIKELKQNGKLKVLLDKYDVEAKIIAS